MKHVAAAILARPLLAGCPEALRADGDVPTDQIPMCGNAEKPQFLRLDHERFIRETAAALGSREAAGDDEKAIVAFIGAYRGIDHHKEPVTELPHDRSSA